MLLAGLDLGDICTAYWEIEDTTKGPSDLVRELKTKQ